MVSLTHPDVSVEGHSLSPDAGSCEDPSVKLVLVCSAVFLLSESTGHPRHLSRTFSDAVELGRSKALACAVPL